MSVFRASGLNGAVFAAELPRTAGGIQGSTFRPSGMRTLAVFAGGPLPTPPATPAKNFYDSIESLVTFDFGIGNGRSFKDALAFRFRFVFEQTVQANVNGGIVAQPDFEMVPGARVDFGTSISDKIIFSGILRGRLAGWEPEEKRVSDIWKPAAPPKLF